MTKTKSLQGQYVLLTGGTDGIGRAVLLKLLDQGAEVVVVGRSKEKWNATHRLIPTAVVSKVDFCCYDLSLMQNVRGLVEDILGRNRQVSILIHCAGVMLRKKTMTAEGLEVVFAVQYLARFYLNKLLISHLEATKGKVIVVSAGGTISRMNFDFNNLQGDKFYNGVHALKHESVANDIQVLEAAKRHPQVDWYNYGPGVVRTGLLRDMGSALRAVAHVVGYCISVSSENAANETFGCHGRRCHKG